MECQGAISAKVTGVTGEEEEAIRLQSRDEEVLLKKLLDQNRYGGIESDVIVAVMCLLVGNGHGTLLPIIFTFSLFL